MTRNPVAKAVRSAVFRSRTVQSRKAYNRQEYNATAEYYKDRDYERDESLCDEDGSQRESMLDSWASRMGYDQ